MSALPAISAPPIRSTQQQRTHWSRHFDQPKVLEPTRLSIEGRLPPGLQGTLLRNGPGVFDLPGGTRTNIFDGDGVVVRAQFSHGQAIGQVRPVDGPDMKTERKAGRARFSAFERPADRWVDRLGARIKNAANTSVMRWNGRLFAMCEGGPPTELDPNTLETLGETNLNGVIPGAFSAHPARVASRHTTYNFGIRYGIVSQLDVFAFPDGGDARRLISVPLDAPRAMHDFIATDHHLVFFTLPLKIDLARMVLGIGAIHHNLHWTPSLGVEVIVVPIDRPSECARFSIDPFMVWHFANAFEMGGTKLAIDYVRFPDASGLDFVRTGRQGMVSAAVQPGLLHRATVDWKRKTFETQPLCEASVEFPQVAPSNAGNTTGPIYMVSHSSETVARNGFFDTIMRVDPNDGSEQAITLGDRQWVTEALFAANPQATHPDEGWLLSTVYDETQHQSYVAVLDAQRLDRGPLAKVWYPQAVHWTFHGIWTPQ